MKTIAIVLSLAVVPVAAIAQTEPTSFYGEAGVGIAMPQDVLTRSYTATIGGTAFSNIRGNLSFNPAVAVSAEAGYAGFYGGNFRAGLSYDYLGVSLRRARLTGAIDGTPVDASFSRSELQSIGLSFDNNVSVLGANLYYNLPLITESMRPYFGVGAGAAIVQKANTVPALSATAGLRIAVGPLGYVGLRYRLEYLQGPTDTLGIRYEPITAHVVSIIIGGYMN